MFESFENTNVAINCSADDEKDAMGEKMLTSDKLFV